MKGKYLIRIETNKTEEHTTINGDSLRPFQIAHNLWNYATPWDAGRRLEKLAKSWESNGFKVERIYGSVLNMPKKGSDFNLNLTIKEFTSRDFTAHDFDTERN